MKNEAFPGPNQDRTYNTKKELISIHKAQRDARRKAEKQAEREEHRAQKLKMVQRKELRRDWDSIEKLDDQEALQAAEKEWFEAVRALFQGNIGEIQSRLYKCEWIYPIDIRDHKAVDSALSGLVGRLGRFAGPLHDGEAFIIWAVNRAVEPMKVEILQERFNAAVFDGVWPVVRKNPDMAADRTLKQTAQDIVLEAWLKFMELEKVDQITYVEGGSLVGYFEQIGYWQAMAQLLNHIREKEKAQLVPFDETYDPGAVRSARKPSLGELDQREVA